MPDEALNPGQGELTRPSSTEINFRRRWYEAHHDRFVADEELYEANKAEQDKFAASAPEALESLEGLRRTGDVEAFVERMRTWARDPETLAFDGHSGQQMLNQLVKNRDDPRQLAELLAESLTAPVSDEEAVGKIQALVNYVENIRVGAHPAPGHVPFLVSYFWGLADHESWPVCWASARKFVEFVTGESLPDDLAARYRIFLDQVREISTDFDEFEMTAGWWDRARPLFMDEVLSDRATLGSDADNFSMAERTANARAMVKVADHWGRQLVEGVSTALGRSMTVGLPSLYWSEKYPRGDVWVDLWTKEASRLGMRVWVNNRGAAVALRPGEVRKGWWEEVIPILESADFPDCQVLGGPRSSIGQNVGFYGAHGSEFVYGRWFDRKDLANVDLAAVVAEVSELLRPLFDKLLALALNELVGSTIPEGDPLESFIAEFRNERNYPTPADEEHKAERRRFAEILAPDAIALADVAEIRRIWNGGGYGGTGPMSGLNRSFRDASAAEYDRMIDSLRYLCWGDDPDETRIDRILNHEEYRISGLGESVIMKLLAITHPDKYLLAYPYSGPKGKRRMLQRLELEEPDGSRGELQVASNQALRARLDRFFPGDPLGMTSFLYWYLERDEEPQIDPEDVLAELAESLLVDRAFLEDIVALLEDKGQVIFYGPPGTGKTYLARKLAEALAPDPSRRALVQFHPSSSYEDFFEGYRPEGGEDEEMTYRLTPGPLALMAARAAGAPGRRHVMIIDEINRANLPKVFGELLFLLEYRGESVRTLYRPDDAFELPQDLWFIGTMNTADRSIALVDAALRRRFHFIPFFPNHGALQGLLERWIERHHGEGARWVWELVAQVNDELEEALGGSHLLVGPSHFMKEDVGLESVKRIWQFNIEPFIEDQFFGDSRQIERFRFEAVYERYQEQSGAKDQSGLSPQAEDGGQASAETGGTAEGA